MTATVSPTSSVPVFPHGDADESAEARRIQQALQEREEQLRLATEAAEVGLWDVNLLTGTLFWQPRVKAMFGISPQVPVSMDDFYAGLHPQDREATSAAFARACDPALRTLYEVEYRTVGKEDGILRWVAAKGRGLFDASGRCVRVLGTAIDISARKRAEQERLQDQERLRRMVHDLTQLHETSTRLAAGRDLQETLQGVMQAALSLSGTARGTLSLVRPQRDELELVASGGFRSAYLQLVGRIPKGAGACGSCWLLGERVVIADTDQDPLFAPYREAARVGGYRAAHATPLLAMDGRVLGVLTLFREQPGRPDDRETRIADLLARSAAGWLEHHQLVQALREADTRKDEFLATLAHELRNPLAPIRNAVHLMGYAGGHKVDFRQLHDMLERQVLHMVRLVDDLMEASRISRGKIELRRERLELADVLRAAVESSRPEMERMGHDFRCSPPQASLPVHGDAVRLAQVFSNLLNNAAHYTERGGRIELSAWAEAGQACVSVRDNGIGIAPEQLPRLFEMFSQVDRRHSGAQSGLGIGLSLAQRLAGMHGGSVRVHSAGLGCGSEFTVRLPLLAPAAAGPRPHRRFAAEALVVARVLVVDDNPDAADSLALLIATLGAQARVAHDGASALALAQDWQPQLVLLDLGMPGMDGYEVARRLRARHGGRALTLAALTGWGQERDRQRTRQAEFDHHLVKPVEPETLRALLTARARGRSATQPASSG
ncbi:PAS domain-containing hybrid sensor histidine kinase/response regulator [Ramlibacter tataouinensis]|uniref:histidine kinase n=1 Tax=Ramlibacter tataouinensis (strain ATCC BAA-407 / DSM 14655 / LMG 21543 / TTB310) TaxID=365046 RepID=F5Y604_RAMTT|nr:ATP-binding protein [Ramlibacter tataouinensis]AEG91508.1 candidate histidine kinase, hybrid [Ramlibacter tataouinensis TTB310]